MSKTISDTYIGQYFVSLFHRLHVIRLFTEVECDTSNKENYKRWLTNTLSG